MIGILSALILSLSVFAAAADRAADKTSSCRAGLPSLERPCGTIADDAIDSRVDELQCVTTWLRRNARFGGLKDGGGAEGRAYEAQRRRAKSILKKIGDWVASAENQPPAPVSDAQRRRSQQRYLSGFIFFQKGDYEKARAEWSLAKVLDPTNADAQAGLERVDKLCGDGKR